MPPNMTSYDNQAASMPTTYDNAGNNTTLQQDEGLLSTSYIKSIPGILKLAEMAVCIVCIICSTVWETNLPLHGGGFVTFVAMTSMIVVVIEFILSIFRIHDKILNSFAIFVTIEFFMYVIITSAYLISAIVAAAYGSKHSSIAACCFFCFVGTAAFGVDTFFAFQLYRNRPRGGGGSKNQATNVESGPGPAY